VSGANAFSLPGPTIAVADMIGAIESVAPRSRGQITVGERLLPFPAAFDGRPIEAALGPAQTTALGDGVADTLTRYRAAIADGRVTNAFLDRVLAVQ
jgi:hypothetical protein